METLNEAIFNELWLKVVQTKLLDPAVEVTALENETEEYKELCQMIEIIKNGNLELLFELPVIQTLFQVDVDQGKSFDESFRRNLIHFISRSSCTTDLKIRQFKILILGSAFLNLFIQVNWTGPAIIIPNLTPQGPQWSYNNFQEDGQIYSKAACLEYLWIARLILFIDDINFSHFKTIHWWRLRYFRILQHLLEERSPKILQRSCDEINKVSDYVLTLNTNLQIQFHLELFNKFLNYYEYEKAKHHLHTAQEKLNLSVELMGALGKRTQFQTRDVAQLTLKVEKLNPSDASLEFDHAQLHLPTDLKLNDDVRLEKIQFKDEQNVQKLTPTEQIIVLCIYIHIQKTNAKEKLVTEELLTYCNLILSQPQCWSVQTMALYLRCKCENDQRRTIERSMRQMQELVDLYSLNKAAPKDRIYLMFSIGLPPKWIFEKSLAHLFIQLGSTSSALDIFLKLEMWEDVIKCYHSIQRRDKAEAVIREQLAIKETPSLWCCLGDATDNPEHYLRAWDISNQGSSRAQKALGILHFKKKEYKECVECLKKSVEVNAIQLDTWFRLGFAAMEIEDWETAAKAYRRCVNLEPDNFEAWNNLANVYLKQKQKHRAWMALQEALRCEFGEIKLWENYLLVSVDIGQISEAITAYHRILDTKDKYADPEVLDVLVKSFEKSKDEFNEGIFTKLCQLFGRVTSKVVNNSLVWKYYGDLINLKADKSPEDFEKVIRFYEKAQRCAVQMSPKWEADNSSCLQVLQTSQQLTNFYLEYCSGDLKHVGRQMLISGRVMLNNIIVKVKSFSEVNGVAFTEDIANILNNLQDKLEEIKRLLQQ